MKLRRRIVVAGAAALAAAALAAPAAHADVDTFTVDSFADANDNNIGNNVCATGGAVCTLRAAVQETNDNDAATDTDVINFAAPIVGTTIQLGAVLDTLDEPLSINGCSTAPNNPAPCVGVRGLNTNTDAFLLTAGATGVTFRGLAFTNTDRGIAALIGTGGLTVKNNWFGIKVDGTDEAIRTGVQVTADDALIGGTAGATGASPADRNVFANATVGEAVGLDVFVGDDAVVQGNWFGTNETGTAAAANGQDITLGGNGSDTATNTTIGGAQPTPGTCSGPCNVISGATTDGIDLKDTHPQEAADTTIQGNFIGFNATGTASVPIGVTGIKAVNAPGTKVGGIGVGQSNYIVGVGTAIETLPLTAPGLVIAGNLIGTNVAGTAPLSPPTIYGILIGSNVTDSPEITGNVIATDLTASDAITVFGDGQEPVGDGLLIGGNAIGVGPGGESLGAGSAGIRTATLENAVISGNTVGGFRAHGITLEGTDGTTVIGNRIGVDSGGGAEGNGGDGIRIRDYSFTSDPATGNTIGGNLPIDQNLISNNGGDAIGIIGDANDGNAILRNRGGPNGTDAEDLFIDLVGTDGNGNGAGGPNGEIEPPDLEAASAARSVGLATPGASVAAFAHTDGEISSLGAFAGVATADSRGLWTITHTAPPPGGQGLANTQTTAGAGTSELSIVGSGFIDPPDASAPGSAISAGPSGPTSDATPSFTLDDPTSDPNFQIFLCALDAGLWEPCGIDGSVYDTGLLADGPHSVSLVGIDEAANLSSTLVRSFTVDTVAPSTTITTAPKAKVTAKKKTVSLAFSFASSEPGQGGFQCQLDNAEFLLCNTGSFSAKVKPGSHTFRVRAYDAAGNPDATLEIRSVKVFKKKKKKK